MPLALAIVYSYIYTLHMSTHPFSKLGVESWLIRVCEKVGYDAPTKI